MKYNMIFPWFSSEASRPSHRHKSCKPGGNGLVAVGCCNRGGESVDVNVKIDFSPYDILWLQYFLLNNFGCKVVDFGMWVENRDNWSIYIEWCLGSLGMKTRKRSQERKSDCAWKICSAGSLADIPVPSDFITYQDLEQFQSFLTLPLCSVCFCNLVLLSDLIISSLLLIFYYFTSCRYPISVICCYFSVQATNEVHGAGPGWRNEVHLDKWLVELDQVQHVFLMKWPCEFLGFWISDQALQWFLEESTRKW